MMLFLALTLACAPSADVSQAPTVVGCPEKSNVTLEPLGPIWSASIRVDGFNVAPDMQIQSDRVIVFCLDDASGILTVEWGKD
jgi:hypothetical protein